MPGLQIEGLAELRADLARMAPALDREVERGLEDAAGFVRDRAHANAPKLTGRMAGSIAVFVEGAAAGVRVTARRVSAKYPSGYAYPWRIERQRQFLARAVTQETPRMERRMEDAMDTVGRIWGGA